MSQSSIIVSALIIGYLIYIVVKGELPSYKAILLGTGSSSSTTTTTPAAASSATTSSASTSATSPSLTGLTAASEELG